MAPCCPLTCINHLPGRALFGYLSSHKETEAQSSEGLSATQDWSSCLQDLGAWLWFRYIWNWNAQPHSTSLLTLTC